ncbi:MAG: hypothetical protein HY026_02745 [Deltaproteobacteria bacterium]|nr:hypothetical protein [Deltaproteobacteria bacterium]
MKRYFDMGDISLTIPYISQKSSGQITVVDGMVFKTRQIGRTPPLQPPTAGWEI